MAIDLASSHLSSHRHRSVSVGSASPDADDNHDWTEQVVTPVATALAVVLVAVVAVLMGSV